MKPKFKPNDPVLTPTKTGAVKQVAPFPDHFEYYVEFPDQTASWIHEAVLKSGSLPTEKLTAKAPLTIQ